MRVNAGMESSSSKNPAHRRITRQGPHFGSRRPLFHWADQKVRVHAAYCVFALLLSALLHREVRGADPARAPGFAAIIETLARIQPVADLPQPQAGKRPRAVPAGIRLTRRDAEQERLLTLLDLQRIHPGPRPTTAAGTAP